MSSLQIEVSHEVERGLQKEAALRGRSVEDIVAAALQERFAAPDPQAGHSGDLLSLFEGLPHRSPEDLLALAQAQGVTAVERFEDLLGDFWPEDETCDEFIAWLRAGRQDRSGESRP